MLGGPLDILMSTVIGRCGVGPLVTFIDSQYGPLIFALSCVFLVWVGFGVRAPILGRYIMGIQDYRLGTHTNGSWS